jgi:hypothetical protein
MTAEVAMAAAMVVTVEVMVETAEVVMVETAVEVMEETAVEVMEETAVEATVEVVVAMVEAVADVVLVPTLLGSMEMRNPIVDWKSSCSTTLTRKLQVLTLTSMMISLWK